MKKLLLPERMHDQEAEYFETYEVKERDLEALWQEIDMVAESKLLEEGVLDHIRFVTYDSTYLYVFSRERHGTNERFVVEEIPSSSVQGFKIFKIAHAGFIGRDKEDYKGARAWLLCDEIETTAVGGKKFSNENVLYEPNLSKPKEILDVVSMAPIEPYNKIQQGRFNHLTDVVFHEAGHIEHRRLKNWQEGEESTVGFPSDEQEERFFSMIKQTKIFPEQITDFIIENTTERAIREMYAMLIDREAAKRYDVQRFDKENEVFERSRIAIQNESADQEAVEQFKKSLKSGHKTGRFFVRILEEQFGDFDARKKFVRSVFTRS